MRTRIEALTAKPFWISALGALLLAAAGAVAPKAWTQETVTAPLTPEQLEELVGPVALYPDELLAIILPASTYPLDIVEAARFLEARKSDPGLEPDEDWDDSIVALLNYPEIIDFLNEDLDWTWTLGEAVLDDQAAVIDATQAFRRRALAAGNLATDDHQAVTDDDGVIEITPIDEKVIYVPYYEPARVVVRQPRRVYSYYPYAYPVYYYPYPVGYDFRLGYFWGVTSAFTIGWHSHFLHVYAPTYYGHPFYGYSYYTPYYYRRGVNITINVNNHDHVWRPRDTRGARPYDGYRARRDDGIVRTYDGRRYRYSEGGGLSSGGIAQRPRPADKSGTRIGRTTARSGTSSSAPVRTTRSGTVSRSNGTATAPATADRSRTRSGSPTQTTPRVQRQERAQMQRNSSANVQPQTRVQRQSRNQTPGRPLTQGGADTRARAQYNAPATRSTPNTARQPRTTRQPRTVTTQRTTRTQRMSGIDRSVSGRPVQPRQYTAPSTARAPQTSRPVTPRAQVRSAPSTPQRQYSAPAQRAPVQRSAPARSQPRYSAPAAPRQSQPRHSAPAAPRQSAPAAPSRAQAPAPSGRSSGRSSGARSNGQRAAPTRGNKGGRYQR